MLFASTVDFPLSLDFFDSGLYKHTAVARLTLALAKLSCFHIVALSDLNYLANDVWSDIVQAMDLGVPVIVRNIPGNITIVTDMQTGLVYDTPQVCCQGMLCIVNIISIPL